MSFRDGNNNEIVTLQGVWGVALKVALTLAVPVLLTLISLGTWTVVKIFEHDTRLALIERDMARAQASSAPSDKSSVAKTQP